jgi:hypothetical protein
VTFIVDNAGGGGGGGAAQDQSGAGMWFSVFRVDSPDSDPVAIDYSNLWG